jgi:hypothetical protein
MDIKLWSVSSQLIAKRHSFSSENEMRDFLLSNYNILGCWDELLDKSTLLRIKELYTKKDTANGRIDLVGLKRDSDDKEQMLIFELKKDAINKEAVDQLKKYMEGLKDDKTIERVSEKIQKVFRVNKIEKETDAIKKLLKEAKGVLVGSDFNDDAIELAKRSGLDGLRVLRLLSNLEKAEYFIFVEDQIGDLTKKSAELSWSIFFEKKLLKDGDKFFIETNDSNIKLFAKPAPITSQSRRCFIFDRESREKILSRREEAEKKAQTQEEKNGFKWLEKLIANEYLLIPRTPATCIVHLTYGLPNGAEAFQNPNIYWKLENSPNSNLACIQAKLD